MSSKSFSKISAVLLVLVVILAGVAAYGWLRSPGTATETNTVTVVTTLEEQARTNDSGHLTIYGVMDGSDFMNIMLPFFTNIYPWTAGRVSYESLDTPQISTRAISEYQANHVTADVLITAGQLQVLLENQGVITNASTRMEQLMNYPNGSYDPNGFWHPAHVNYAVIERNTNLYPTQQIFKYEDLADPKWKGKIAMDNPAEINTAGGLFIGLRSIWNETYWNATMRAIAANNPIITPGAGDTYNGVKTGQYGLGIGFINDYLGRDPADPVALDIISPAVYTANAASMTTHAPHPFMAQLFLQFWASYAGQTAIAASHRIPSHPGVAAQTTLAGVFPAGIQTIRAGDGTDLWQNPDKWTAIMHQLFGT
jgi:ABC-type Fe3+ transport system substrate-binding protein